MPVKGKKYSNSEAISKLQKYCAYQERCQQEVNQKLYEWGFLSDDRSDIIVNLIESNFLNEERYARAYCRGKFRQKLWGRNKIRQGLKMKGISSTLIKIAMEEIDEKEYINALMTVVEKKNKLMKESNPYIRKNKLIQYAAGKGFEQELICEILKAE